MSYIPKYTITDKIRDDLQDIERLKNTVQNKRLLPKAEASIRLRASVESVHSSTSIEGNPLNDNEVRAIIYSDRILSKEQYAEIEVQNYKKALDYIDSRRYGDTKITMEDILELHRIITDRLLDKTRNGKLRQNPVYIENQDHKTIYTAIAASRIRQELQDLVEWIANSQFSTHPILIAAIIHFRIAAIHPFADGNGRTARALVSLFLALNQYDCNGSLVLDTYYADNRKAYYSILQLVNGKNYTASAKANLTPWIEYFTEGFLSSLHVLDAEIKILNVMLPNNEINNLDSNDQEILSFIHQFGAITISEAESILPEANRRAIQRKLKRLVEASYLKKVGETKNVKYILAKQKNNE